MSALSISTIDIEPEESRNSDIISIVPENLTNGHDQTPENELAESMLETELTNGLKESDFPPLPSINTPKPQPVETNGFEPNLGFNGTCDTKENYLNDIEIDDIHSESCLKHDIINKIDIYKTADINHNGEIKKCEESCVEEDSDNEKSESKSEITLCASPKVVTACRTGKSNETSTDTLVAENGVISR